ncbi:hypothetical protein CR513_10487, partial [Mucuna pruriens]
MSNSYSRNSILKIVKGMSTLMHPTSILSLDKTDKKADQTSYRGMIDSLLYLTTSRLDIMLKGYNEANFTRDRIKRKSTNEGCHFIRANLIKHQLEDYDIIESDIPLLCDNITTINLSKNPILHSYSKNIETKHYFIRDYVQKGTLYLKFINTKN